MAEHYVEYTIMGVRVKIQPHMYKVYKALFEATLYQERTDE